MYFITNTEDLEGKTIGFTNVAQFSDYILVVTTDGGIFCACQEFDDFEERRETSIPRINEMENYVFQNRYFLEELEKRNIITSVDIKNYKKKKEDEIKKQIEKRNKQEEENERRRYEELKAKFEKKD